MKLRLFSATMVIVGFLSVSTWVTLAQDTALGTPMLVSSPSTSQLTLATVSRCPAQDRESATFTPITPTMHMSDITPAKHLVGLSSLPIVQVTAANGDNDPAIVQAADGRLWVFFESDRSAGAHYIWYQTSVDGGSTWSAPAQFTSDHTDDYDPAVYEATGKLWVVWFSNRSGSGDLYLKTSTDNGTTWSSDTRLTTDSSADRYPDIVRAGNKLCVVWTAWRSGNADIWYKSSVDGGATWSEDTQLTNNASEDSTPTIAQAGDGKLWIVWQRSSRLWYRTSSDGGVNWLPEAPVSAASGYESPDLTVATDGMLWLASDCTGEIWYQTSADDGASWSAPRGFTRYVGNDYHPGVAAMNNGHVAVVWQSERIGQWTSNIWYGIFGLLEDIDPPPWAGWMLHTPGQPLSTEVMTITMFARDESPGFSVKLAWSKDGVPQSDLSMYDDGTHGDGNAGDSLYGVQIGPFAAGTTVRDQARITDSDGNVILHPLAGPYSFQVLEPPTSATPTPTATPSCSRVREAEHGIIQPPMTVASDTDASNGQYVYSPVAYEGYVSLSLCVETAGDYNVWGRVSSQGVTADSFFVSVDGGGEFIWDIGPPGWLWRPATDRDAGGIAPIYHFAAGTHVVRVRSRGAGARLDVVELRPVIATPTPVPGSPTAAPSPTPSMTATPAGPEQGFRISAISGNQVKPAVAHDPSNGYALLVWQDQSSGAAGPDVYGQLATAMGGLIGGEIEVSAAERDQLEPELAYNSHDDEYLAVWYDGREVDYEFYIRGQRISSSGALVGERLEIATATTWQIEPDLAYNATRNEYLVVWSDGAVNVLATRLAADGTLMGAPFAVTEAPRAQYDASVAYNPDRDEYLIVWHDFRNSEHYDIWAQRVSGQGQLLGGNFAICEAEGHQYAASIAYGAGSHLYLVTWQDVRGGEGNSDIYGQMVHDEGWLWANPIPVCTATLSQQETSVAYNLARAEYLVVWADVRTGQYDIMAQRVSAQGELLGGNDAVCSANGHQNAPDTADLPGTQSWFVVWQDERSGQADIYGRAYPLLPTPTATPTASATATATGTLTPTPSPTLTATPPGDLMLSGRVYDAALGPLHGVSGANVSAILCMPRSFHTLSEADGSYSVLLPALYLNQCVSITLEATASGYQMLSFAVPVADLRAQPVRDLALIPLSTPTPTVTQIATPTGFHLYIPVVIKAGQSGATSAPSVSSLKTGGSGMTVISRSLVHRR